MRGPNKLSEEEFAARKVQSEAMAAEMGFEPGTTATVIAVRNSPYGTDLVIRRNQAVWHVSGIPGDKDRQVAPDTVSVATKPGNYTLSDLSRWREMSADELQAEMDSRNDRYWAEFPGRKPKGCDRFRHELQIVLREVPGYYCFRRASKALGIDLI